MCFAKTQRAAACTQTDGIKAEKVREGKSAVRKATSMKSAT